MLPDLRISPKPLWLAGSVALGLAVAACAPGGGSEDVPASRRAAPTLAAAATSPTATEGAPEADSAAGIAFTAIQDAAGLAFRHDHGGTGERYMPETIGAGGGLADFDGDGLLDVYLVQGGSLDGAPAADAPSNRLFRNLGDGRFEDVTEASGAGDTGYGMGTCFADVDNDGDQDIYVANVGPDVLLRNLGGGRFEDATAEAGLGNEAWASSCAFADYDADGCLDLYVVNYLDFTVETHKRCGSEALPLYCHPDEYDGVADRLYRGACDGRFQDVTEAAGVAVEDPGQAKGLGVAWLDYDDDGDADLYVANDSTRNHLFRNEGDGTFTEVAITAGVGFNEEGKTEAGMGIAVGDVGEDGRLDLYVTHLDFETNTLYRNQGEGYFDDETAAAGLAAPSVGLVGFGAQLFDADQDGDEDLYVANGHIIDNIAQANPGLSFAQPDQIFENRGDARFADASAGAGPAVTEPAVSRAVATGDVDGDGDLDLLVTRCDGAAALLRNDTLPAGPSLILDLRSRHGGRPAVGARAALHAGGRTQIRELRAGDGYQSQSDTRLHFGLGDAEAVERLVIRWPGGAETEVAGDALRLDAPNRIDEPADG